MLDHCFQVVLHPWHSAVYGASLHGIFLQDGVCWMVFGVFGQLHAAHVYRLVLTLIFRKGWHCECS